MSHTVPEHYCHRYDDDDDDDDDPDDDYDDDDDDKDDDDEVNSHPSCNSRCLSLNPGTIHYTSPPRERGGGWKEGVIGVVRAPVITLIEEGKPCPPSTLPPCIF